jgi:hypothetical protein
LHAFIRIGKKLDSSSDAIVINPAGQPEKKLLEKKAQIQSLALWG